MSLKELREKGDAFEERCNTAVDCGDVGGALRFGLRSGGIMIAVGLVDYTSGMVHLDGTRASNGMFKIVDGVTLPAIAPFVANLKRDSV